MVTNEKYSNEGIFFYTRVSFLRPTSHKMNDDPGRFSRHTAENELMCK